MNLIRKYTQWKSVPTKIQDAYKNNRYKVVIPDTRDFRITVIDWAQVDWVNYICMKGRMWDNKGKDIKL